MKKLFILLLNAFSPVQYRQSFLFTYNDDDFYDLFVWTFVVKISIFSMLWILLKRENEAESHKKGSLTL